MNPSLPRDTLVVALRGWGTTGEPLLFGRCGGDFPPEFTEILSREIRHSEIWCPDLDMGILSTRSAEDLAREVFDTLDGRMRRDPRIERVVLFGFSAGSVIARRVFTLAHGLSRDGRESWSAGPAPWAHRIERLVILSGITRGWELTSATPPFLRFFASALIGLLRWTTRIWNLVRCPSQASRLPLILQLQRGAPFIIETRIQYVTLTHRLRKALGSGRPGVSSPRDLRSGGVASTVFLLGARDEFISPADCAELGPRPEFLYLELPGCRHSDAVQIGSEDAGTARRRMSLVAALSQPFSELQESAATVCANDIDDYLDPMDRADSVDPATDRCCAVQHAVMILHGIRDHGFWTKRVAREVRCLGRREGIAVRAPSPSYGYFSMWDFVKPGGRERAAYWFLERYAEVRTLFPEAEVSFVGHSNGTYLAARALQLSAAVSFAQVVFAGSVVLRSFDWSEYPGRVRRVCNYVSDADFVVGFFPAVFERLRLSWLVDVGGAGAFGFQRPPPGRLGPTELRAGSLVGPTVHEVRYVPGGHGAAVSEDYWRELAEFALLGQHPSRPCRPRECWQTALMWAAPVFTPAAVAIALVLLILPVAGPVCLWFGLPVPPGSAVSVVGWILVFIGCSSVFRRFLRQW